MSTRRNILMFMPETLRADAVFGAGGRRALTPNMDALGDEGVRFENCYSQHSVCSPSRISMFTGLYPHTRGQRTLANLIRPFEHNLFKTLRNAGYETVVLGKNDMMFPDTARESFDRWWTETSPEAPGKPYPHCEGDRLFYSFLHGRVGTASTETDRNGHRDSDWAKLQDALAYLDRDHEKPFCLIICTAYAHPPYRAPEPFYSMYDPADAPQPYKVDYDKKRRYARMIRENYGLDAVSDEEWRDIRRLYLAMTSRLDDQFGQLVAKLKERGLWDRTATFVFSDHGDFCGDYGLVEKWFSACEDCIVKVPLIMRVPGHDAVGSRRALVEMVDLYPTVLAAAGVEDTHYHFGRSLLGLHSADASDEHREVVFSEGGHNIDEAYIHDIAHAYRGYYHRKCSLWRIDPLAMAKAWMVRDERYKYVYCPEEFDELYDMHGDPGETVNLADRPEFENRIRAMRDALLAWLSRTADQIPEDEHRCNWPPRPSPV